MTVVLLTPLAQTEALLRAICAKYCVPLADVRGRGQARVLCAARAECYALLRDRGWSLVRIGRYFGGRHYSSVCVAMRPGRGAFRAEYMRRHYARRKVREVYQRRAGT